MCQPDGTYSAQAPTCVGMFGHPVNGINNNCYYTQTYTAITCGQLSDPENGNVRQRRPAIVGSVALYVCNSGFRLDGQRTRVCQSDGSYSGQAPTCVGMFIVNKINVEYLNHNLPLYSQHLCTTKRSSEWECEAAKSSNCWICGLVHLQQRIQTCWSEDKSVSVR